MDEASEKVEIWLIGDTNSNLDHTKLPLVSDVLKLFFYHQRIGHNTIDGSAKKAAFEILSIWNKTAIPTMLPHNVTLKIVSLKKKHEIIKKSRYRNTDIQQKREMEFILELNTMFDIMSKNDTKISPEQMRFLEDQRGPRQIEVSSLKPLAIMKPFVFGKDYSDTDSDSDSLNESDGSDFEDSLSAYESDDSYEPKPKMLRTILNSTTVTSALDRVNMKNGEFTIVAAAIAHACKVDINRDVLSVSTVRRKRNRNRTVIGDNIKQEFYDLLEKHTSGLVIHFDGKRLPDYTASNRDERELRVERVAIVITGQNIEKLLGIVKCDDGTGAKTAEAVHLLLLKWDEWNEKDGKNKSIKIRDRIIGMSFDTTNANTGHIKGACKLFEERFLKRNVLYLACRHHVYEVVVGGIFKKLFGESKSPNVEIFDRFKSEWKNIDKKKFKGLQKGNFKKPFAAFQRKETIEFLLHALSVETTYMPRGDYKEIIELCLLVLGHPLKNYRFKAPGATHHARWMAKIIYSFKMYLFRDQFDFTSEEKSNFREMCLFASLLYVKAWIKSPLTADAPINDLTFFKALQQYTVISKTVSDAAIEKFENHLWYIGPELIVLSLFSDKITSNEKCLIFKKIKQQDKHWSLRGIRLENTESLNKKQLPDLVGSQSMNVLKSLNFDMDFMYNIEPEKWFESKQYQLAKLFVMRIQVVNDPAERALALMTDYNSTLTKNEFQKQLILQVVEDNRKKIKNYKKKNLSTKM